MGPSGEPLTGATVRLETTPVMVSTEDKGNFTLLAVPDEAVLQISHVGFIPRQISMDKLKNGNALPSNIKVSTYGSTIAVNIRLVVNVRDEEAVTIVTNGYQQIAKAKITGAATSVSREKYDQRVAVTGNF